MSKRTPIAALVLVAALGVLTILAADCGGGSEGAVFLSPYLPNLPGRRSM
ncbi:MAG: hypothetical protein ACE5IZ_04645 [Dehalococcoidia bacterium]